MKTLDEIKGAIDRTLKTLSANNLSKNEKRNFTDRYLMLMHAKSIVELGTSEESLRRQLEDKQKQIDILEKRFEATPPNRPPKFNGSLYSLHKRLYGYDTINRQITLLKYVLND